MDFRSHLTRIKVVDLREIVKAINTKTRIIYSKLKKADLIEEILKHADMYQGKIYTRGFKVKPKQKSNF